LGTELHVHWFSGERLPKSSDDSRLFGKLNIEFHENLLDSKGVKIGAQKKERTEADLLDQAAGQLLKAVKQKMLKKQGRLDHTKLRKDGYSDRFIARLDDV
jgi:hypothetical protein